MLYNYCKTAFRNIQRNPVYFFINLVGLSIGITCCLMILLFVRFEFSFDQFHKKKDRIYRLNYNFITPDNQAISPTVPVFVAPHLKKMFPEIEDATRLLFSYNPVAIGDESGKLFEETKFTWADSNFFELLDFKAVKGDLTNALRRPKTLVLTESTAKKYFGDEDPIGKVLLFGGQTPFEVTAIIENVPQNSHFSFDLMTSIYSKTGIDDESINWNNPDYTTFLLVRPGVNIPALQTKINDWVIPPDQRSKSANLLTLDMEKLTEVHFNTEVTNYKDLNAVTDIKYLYVFLSIAALVLLIACINYINLATARASTRAKEVGIRKTSGANFSQLIFQYLTESFFLLLPAIVMAVVATQLLMPLLNFMIGRKIEVNFITMEFMLTIAMGWILLSFLAGFYPALVLSRFKPATVLKGKSITIGGISLRKGLVMVQFFISTMLITGTLVVFSQLKFMQSTKLGMDKENILFIRSNNHLKPNLQTFIHKVRNIPGVEKVAGTTRSPFETIVGHGFNLSPNPKSEGWTVVGGIAADSEYLEAMGMQLTAGRNFDPAKVKDTINEFIVNEAFLMNFNLSKEEAIGKQVTLGIVMNHGPGTIIGVVKDFHFASLHQAIKPAVLFNNPDWIVGVIVRLSPGNPQPSLQQIEREWKALAPERPFNYMFLDDQYDTLYRTEQRISKLAAIFSTIAVVVACLGLFGLATFTSIQRMKEISIRKILGATTMGITVLLSSGYLRLLIISFVLAVPGSYYLLNLWLQNFAFKINMDPVYFLSALGILMTVSLITVGYQSYRASATNPAENLRLE